MWFEVQCLPRFSFTTERERLYKGSAGGDCILFLGGKLQFMKTLWRATIGVGRRLFNYTFTEIEDIRLSLEGAYYGCQVH